ncbi:MAG: VOC family protein [bacterium]
MEPEQKSYDRSLEDVGNVQLLEHVNLTVPDQSIASMFYVTGLGFTRDPYIDFGTLNMWVNMGDQQFHLPTRHAQVLRGHIGVVVPDLDELSKRLTFAARGLKDTAFKSTEGDYCLELTCPFGNTIKAYTPASFPRMDLGMPYIQFDVPPDTSAGIAKFYAQVLGCPSQHENDITRVAMGHNQSLIFKETDVPLAAYDGHHIAIYVADFSGPHAWLSQRGLISEESDQFQYRFVDIVDPDSGAVLYQVEHEVRSLSHAMYRRPLVNRNPNTNFFTYRKGNEQFSPAQR